MTGNTDMGLYFHLSALSPSLKIGVAPAISHYSGKVLVLIDV